jgi:hypothetical protein
MSIVRAYEHSLLQQFIASFEKLNEMVAVENIYPITWELAIGDSDQYGCKRWRPIEKATEEDDLDSIYSQLPARFPQLYEQLVLSYRWAEVDLKSFTLLANPPGPGLGRPLYEISKDPTLWIHLRKAGFIQFGKGPDLDYDPVCFDISSRKTKAKDYRIVKIDHEQMLCYERVKIVEELAPSFEALIRATIERANLPVPNH